MSFKLRVTSVGVLARIALLGAVAGMLAGCSSEVTRFAEVSSTDPTPTGTALIPSVPVGQNDLASSAAPIRSRVPSAPIQSSALPAPNPSYSVPSTPNPRLASAPVRSTPVREATSTIASKTAITGKPSATGNWSAIGGTPVTVAQGESLSSMSNKYGVPQDVLLKSNGLSASQVQPGTRLVIPVYSVGGGATAAHAPVSTAPAKVEQARTEVAKPAKESLRFTRGAEAAGKQVATKVEPVRKIEPKVADVKSAPAKVADAKDKKVPAAKAALGKPGDKKPAQVAETKPVAGKPAAAPAKTAKVDPAKVEPAKTAAKPADAAKPAKTAATDKAAPAAAKPGKQQVAKADPAPVETVKTTKKTDAITTGTVHAAETPAAEAASDSANPEFRWPAKGRVIQGFKAGTNDGINISVPEGTSVKAAESGVVAYAGNELKGYGNLVLIRHPNGFVSAYANNGDIEVKRGDTVKRGQTIAKSGQTGNVNAPQLHFELRKGSTPVDPTGYLAGL